MPIFPIVPENRLDESNQFFMRQQMGFNPNAPRSPEGFLMSSQPRSVEGFVGIAPTHPNAIAMATNFATLQNASRGTGGGAVVKDTISPDDYVASSDLYTNRPDADLVKAQIARGGSAALNVLRAHNPQGGGRMPVYNGGGLDYSGIKPIRDNEELFRNKAFVQLATNAPNEAAKVYKSLTGRDFATDMQERHRLEAATLKATDSAVTEGIMSGKLRRSPETGMIQRLVQETDPKNPIGGKIDVWRDTEAEFQVMAGKRWDDVTGFPSSEIVSKIPARHQPFFVAEYRKNLEAGLDHKTAIENAIKAVPSDAPTPTTAPSTPAAVTPTAAAANPAPTNDAEFQAWMTARAQESNNEFGKWGDQFGGAVTNAMMGVGAAGGEVLRVGGNMMGGISNLVNRGAMMVSGGPVVPWYRPTTREELAARSAEMMARQQTTPAQQKAYQEIMANMTPYDFAPGL